MQKMMVSEVENLMWAQEVLDYHVELGGALEELYKLIGNKVMVLKSHITLDVDPIELFTKTLPELDKWLKALSELNTFRTTEGQQEPGFIDKDWLVMEWGLFVQKHEDRLEDRELEEAVPFLQHMQVKYGTIESNDLEDWAEYIFGDEMESVLRAWHDSQALLDIDIEDIDELQETYLQGARDMDRLADYMFNAAQGEDYEAVDSTIKKMWDVVEKLKYLSEGDEC